MIRERQKQLTELRRIQQSLLPLKTLIHHSFFEELTERKPHFVSPQLKKRKIAFTADEDSDFLKVSPDGSPSRLQEKENTASHSSPFVLNKTVLFRELADSPSFRNKQMKEEKKERKEEEKENIERIGVGKGSEAKSYTPTKLGPMPKNQPGEPLRRSTRLKLQLR
eukprot:TRINITY_DN1677_c0_g2_i12.p1 TRINITY_DN1677_c0_g2~~TRINITY_DN1677_c0_g2_i12.p1  ORF type:complete len:166 (+),score=45.31 TRINITY_DN1677_c0_g2_i12:368-865(+)